MPNASRYVAIGTAAVAVGLGIYAMVLRGELSVLRLERDAAVGARARADQFAADARSEVTPLKENVERLKAERDALRGTARENTNSTSTAASTGSPVPSAGALAQTFATPEMKQMLRQEALRDARKGFTDLLKQWNLSAAEADQFLEFVAQADGANDADALAMFGGGKIDAKTIADQEAKAEAAKAESAKRLKDLLGEARYLMPRTLAGRKCKQSPRIAITSSPPACP
jgi:hypothetical protein